MFRGDSGRLARLSLLPTWAVRIAAPVNDYVFLYPRVSGTLAGGRVLRTDSPRVCRIRGKPKCDVTSLHERAIVLGPVAHAVLRFVLGVDS